MRATLRALSDARWTVVAFAVAAFGLTLLQSVAFFRMAGHTFAERAAFGYSLLLQATASEALYPPPVHPETAAGYLELRALWPLGILLAAWAMVSATKTTTAAIGPRAAAFGVSTSLAAAATCVGVLVGVSSGGESVSGTGLVEAGVLLVALAMACYAICIVIAQITSDPALLATGVMLTLFFVNSLGRVFASLETARWLSPFRYYELSAPLPPGGRFDVGGFVILLAIAAIGITLAFVLSAGRIGHASLVRAATYDPAHATLLNIPVVRNLYPHRLALGAWCIAFAALGVVLVAATRTSMQDLLALPRGLTGLPQYIYVFYAQALGTTWFDVSVLMFAAIAFAFVRRWRNEDRDGRLEVALSAPYSRSALVVERLAGLTLVAAIFAIFSGLAVGFTSRAQDLAIDSTRLADACLLLLVFGIVLGAAGSLFVAWWPRAAPAVFGGFVLAAYLDDQIGGALGWPGWVQHVSPFRLVGAPLAAGLDAGSLALLLALAVAGAGISILLMQRRDVAR